MSIHASAIAVGIAMVAGATSVAAQPCPLYVLERAGDDFTIQRETMPDGAATAYMWGGEFVTLLLPWSEGQSGNVIQASAQGATAARCESGTLTITIQRPGAEPRVLPPVDATTVARFRMRVSITPAEGPAVVFLIAPDGSIGRDMLAPATDMFRGMVPLQPGDVSVTTEIREAEAGPGVVGTVELRRGGPYFLATLAVPGGGEGDVIVDFGASRTLLSEDMLPPGITPVPLTAVEHGAEGDRETAGSLGAFGGEVDGVTVARLPEVRLGPVSLRDVRVNVLPRLPELAGLTVKGIVGADLLQHARIVHLTALPGGGRLEFAAAGRQAKPVFEVPFSMVGGLIVMRGTVDGRPVPLILDTGARASILTESAARALDLQPLPGEGDTFRGLDGTPFRTWAALIPSLLLGDGSLDAFRVNVGRLPVLEQLGLPGGGLLGQDLWERFGGLEVDWNAEVVRFFE